MSACSLPLPHGDLPATYPWADAGTDHVILEIVEKAADESAWIVRVYECKQYRSNAVTINLRKPMRKAVACNLLEEDERPVAYQSLLLTFAIKPFEIKTKKIRLA